MAFRTRTTTAHRGSATLLALTLLFGLIAASLVSAPPAQAVGGNALREAANAYRVEGGLKPVVGTALLDNIADARAADMAAKDDLEHDMQYVKDRLNAAGVCWSGYGEIIAFSSRNPYDPARTLVQWWNSEPHRNVLMGAHYDGAGGAYDQASDGAYYSVMIFVAFCDDTVPGGSTGSTPFTDIAGSPFRGDIEWLYESGITSGCDHDSFCPTAGVTRAQMASFLDRALDLPSTNRDFFSDDNGLVHEAAINRLAAAGITSGCSAGRFCPGGGVTREQMASFLVRATDLDAGAGLNLFADDDSSIHEFDIDRLAYGGVTSGCDYRRYCPAGTVTRGQMAAFLHRAFG